MIESTLEQLKVDGTLSQLIVDGSLSQLKVDGTISFNEVTHSNILYGLLYNGYAVNDARGLAPTGWHIPTYDEVQTLITAIGGIANGGTLKEDGTDHWQSPNTGATNSTGLTILPNGRRNGNLAEFEYLGTAVYIWNSTISESSYLGYWYLDYNSGNVTNSTGLAFDAVCYLFQGKAIRCIRDTDSGWTIGEAVMDYDGNVYTTVKIESQVWLVQNLAVTHYRNGDVISEVADAIAWRDLTTGALCAYNNDWDNVNI